ncbi:MAG: hemolysin III family protein [Myxococcota bacterium]
MSEHAGVRIQSRAEELLNTLSHGFGALVGGIGLAVLLGACGGEPWRIVAASVYGASVVLLFLASTLYHALRRPRAKAVLQVVDHVCIFALIAGTYTPFALVTLRGPWGWALLGTTWGLALVGSVLETAFLGRFPRLSTAAYLATGWVGVIAVVPLWNALPGAAWGWLLGGGLAYTVGVAFFAWEKLPFHHTVWHVFVLAGAACHFVAVLHHVLPA